jgi:hypothetical protein
VRASVCSLPDSIHTVRASGCPSLAIGVDGCAASSGSDHSLTRASNSASPIALPPGRAK